MSDVLIDKYNSNDQSVLSDILTIYDKNKIECLELLEKLEIKNIKDAERCFDLINSLDFLNLEVANLQASVLIQFLTNQISTDSLVEKSTNNLQELIRNGSDEIVEQVFQKVRYSLRNKDGLKYSLLISYISRTENFEIIKDFFYDFNNPVYIFDLMIKLYSVTPTYRFNLDLFSNGISRAWQIKPESTEELTLNLFTGDSTFAILAVKVLFVNSLNPISIDLLKLKNKTHQLNAIKAICKFPHSFDKLLPTLIVLRRSRFKDVVGQLQTELSKKVYETYHDTIYKKIKNSITKTKKDIKFLEPIKEALDDYHKLKTFKESINDLNPFENEKTLIDLYYRLEREENVRMMNTERTGTIASLFKKIVIVRGNSIKYNNSPPTKMAKIESSLLIDLESYRNPDLYEHKLNIIE